MHTERDQNRFEKLRVMILQMATGNFAHRLEVDEKCQDEIQDLGFLLNMLAEELSDLFIYPGYFGDKNAADPYVFVIDSHFKIQAVNKKITMLVHLNAAAILGKPVGKFLTIDALANLKAKLNIKEPQTQTAPLKIMLAFATPSVTHHCWGYLHRIKARDGFYFVFRGLPLAVQNQKEITRPPKHTTASIKGKTLQLQSDIIRMRNVHQYILENLNQTLPSLPSIARQFNLNEYKLKKGFKELYGTSIFKFHLEKRLEMALLMIQNTPMSLKSVALQFGFRNYTHFSKAFKIKFGVKPSAYKNNSDPF